jgi:hypothetical protein
MLHMTTMPYLPTSTSELRRIDANVFRLADYNVVDSDWTDVPDTSDQDNGQ